MKVQVPQVNAFAYLLVWIFLLANESRLILGLYRMCSATFAILSNLWQFQRHLHISDKRKVKVQLYRVNGLTSGFHLRQSIQQIDILYAIHKKPLCFQFRASLAVSLSKDLY